MFHGDDVVQYSVMPQSVRKTTNYPSQTRKQHSGTHFGTASSKFNVDVDPHVPPFVPEHPIKNASPSDLPSRFLNTVEARDNGEALKEFLLCGYYRVQSLSNHLKIYGFTTDAKSFLKQCSYKTYYRLFSPLHPHHPRPYHDQREIPRDVDTLTKIQVELFALENGMGDTTVKAGLKITAEWSPALWELRSWKVKDGPGHPQKQIEDVLETNVEYTRLPPTGDMLKKAILDYSFGGNTAFFGPNLVFTTSRSGEQKTLGGYAFTHVHAATRPKRLGASLSMIEPLLTDGDLQRFPFDNRVATFHITSNEPIREIKFAPTTNLEILQLDEQARLLSRGNDWLVDGVEFKLLLRDIHSQDRDDPRQIASRQVPFKPEQDDDRSKILVKLTFKRNWRSWFWKIIFPIDIITIVGFNVFLLLPITSAGPSADQRIAITTYLATVLLAQAAFTISVQPMLPKVSYMTILDVHTNFCFLMTALQAVLFVTIPNTAWGTFATTNRRYLAFGLALVLLFLEHLFTFFISPRMMKKTLNDPPPRQLKKVVSDPEKAQHLVDEFRS